MKQLPDSSCNMLSFRKMRLLCTSKAILSLLIVVLAASCRDRTEVDDTANDFPTVLVAEGYRLEKVVENLTFPTSIAWDDQGRMYVAEAGGGLDPDQLTTSRIMRITDGQAQEFANLTAQGINASVVGMVYHNSEFYFTHRDANDLTGAVSKVNMNGQITKLFSDIIDSQSEHQINDIRVGPDGRMYIGVGLAANSGVVGPDLGPWVMESRNVMPRPCQDIVLKGYNFLSENPMDENGDSVLTGAFVPFGTATQPGQVIQGVAKCGGSVLAFNPANPQGSLEMYAWGIRQPIGIAWVNNTMYVSENGYDVRGSRPIRDEYDATLRIQPGQWHGAPDFSAAREPFTNQKFFVRDENAPVFMGQQREGKLLDFVIDHAASGLSAPDPSMVAGLHPVHSSPCKLDVAPAAWGDFAGHLFVAEWGDLAPPTNPDLNQAVGSRVVRINPNGSRQVESFLQNAQQGPASDQGSSPGEGLERPFDVKFGPDGHMYIVDYGRVEIDMDRKPPYDYRQGTGVVWRVVRR